MKKFSTLLLSTLFSLSIFAYDGTRLSISAPGTSSELQVEIDGRPFSMKNNSITLSYLDEGSHQVKIFHERRKNAFGFGRRDVIFNNSIYLKRGFHLDITVNRFGKTMVDERPIDRNDEWYNDEDDYYDSDNGGLNNSYGSGYSNVMSGRDFDQVTESLRKEWFENNRLTSAKYIISQNSLTTQQVKELMLLFTFEDNRLEVAKAAYCKTVDQRNYYQLNDALTFSSSKDELARFIRESQK